MAYSDRRQRLRVGSGLLVAEKQFRRIQGHKQIPILLRELEALVPSKSEVVKRRKASQSEDALFDQAVAAGGEVTMPVKDQFYGDRSGTLSDPFGHVWTIATRKEDLAPEEIQNRAAAAMSGHQPRSASKPLPSVTAVAHFASRYFGCGRILKNR